MKLTTRGSAWLTKTPEVFMSPNTSHRVEARIDRMLDDSAIDAEPEVVVRGILDTLGVWNKVEEYLHNEPAMLAKRRGPGAGPQAAGEV
jgi:hypothetical protein